MIFRDDECRIRTEHAPGNFTTLRHMAHSLIRKAAGKYRFRLKRKITACDDDLQISLPLDFFTRFPWSYQPRLAITQQRNFKRKCLDIENAIRHSTKTFLTWNVRHFLSSVLPCTVSARSSRTFFLQICSAARAQHRHDLVTAREYVGVGGGETNDLLRRV